MNRVTSVHFSAPEAPLTNGHAAEPEVRTPPRRASKVAPKQEFLRKNVPRRRSLTEPSDRQSCLTPPPPTFLTSLSTAVRDSALAAKMIERLQECSSSDFHGNLQVISGALRRAVAAVEQLIETEEQVQARPK